MHFGGGVAYKSDQGVFSFTTVAIITKTVPVRLFVSLLLLFMFMIVGVNMAGIVEVSKSCYNEFGECRMNVHSLG